MWVVYILICSDNTFYTGITIDIQRRLIEHNDSNKWAKYTKTRRPVQIIYTAHFNTRSEASKEEHRIKNLTRKQKEELIKN
jgi:putative endonuclease